MFNSLFLLLDNGQTAVNAALEAAPKGDLNQYAWVIICAMAAVIFGMGLFGGKLILRLYSDLEKCNNERLRFASDHVSLLETLRDEVVKQRPKP